MDIRELKISGAWEITPRQFPDDRGLFLEAYKSTVFEQAIGHRLDVRQANTSVSKAGTVRGIHFADVPPSQAKYVMCPRGAVLDFAMRETFVIANKLTTAANAIVLQFT